MAEDPLGTDDWLRVIATELGFLCSAQGNADGTVVEKAQFLMQLGLPRAQAAAAVGSTDDSIRVLLARKKGTQPAKATRIRRAAR